MLLCKSTRVLHQKFLKIESLARDGPKKVITGVESWLECWMACLSDTNKKTLFATENTKFDRLFDLEYIKNTLLSILSDKHTFNLP